LGYLANQISMFQKLLTFATNRTPRDLVEQKITGVNTQMMARFMVGVLHEGWRLVKDRFISRPIGNEYLPLLDRTGREALSNLRRHFGRSNLLSTLRDDFAYHLPTTDDVETAFEAVASDPQRDSDWNWYLSAMNFNTLYFPCDLVILQGMMHASREADLISAQKKIMHEVRIVSDLMMEFIPAFCASVWRKHFGSEMQGDVCLKKTNAPSLLKVWIPFFVEAPRPRKTRKRTRARRAKPRTASADTAAYARGLLARKPRRNAGAKR
jgi:hypothetical protein